MLVGPRTGPRGALPNVQTPPDQFVPYILPPQLPTDKNTHCGSGMICPVESVTANVTYNVTHGMGHIAQFGRCLYAGESIYPPRLKLEPGGNENVQPIQLEADVAAGFVEFF